MNAKRRRYRLKKISINEIRTKYPYKVVNIFKRDNSQVLQLDNLRIVFKKK